MRHLRTQCRARRCAGDPLDALDDERDALAHADAHRAQRVAALGALQLVHRGGAQARAAGAGPMPMMRGATPAVAMPTTRARGVSPFFAADASPASNSAQAPSFTPEA